MNGSIELTEKQAEQVLLCYVVREIFKDKPEIKITSMRMDPYSSRFLTVKFTDEPEKEDIDNG